MIRVYSKTNCQQCRMTERWLQKNNIDYVHEDATDPMNLEAIQALDYSQAPVVVVSTPAGDRHWSGFNPEKLNWYTKGLGSTDAWHSTP